jgi:hypothetical protein
MTILIALGALSYFGVLDSDNLRSSECTFSPGIFCDEFSLSTQYDPDRHMYLNLLNTYGVDLNVSAISATNDELGYIDCSLNSTGSLPVTWPNEELEAFKCEIPSQNYYNGQAYEFVVNILFTQVGNSYQYNTSGTVRVSGQ